MDPLARFCASHGLKLNTDLGQHFLRDEDVLAKIVDAADIQATDHVVEVGPGIGVLTRELLKRAGRVTAIELDQRLIPLLHAYLAEAATGKDSPRLTIIAGNALRTPMPDTPYTIVANIPYQITSPLLRHVFLESKTHPRTITLLIQREVAEKIVDTENAGLLTILVGLFGRTEMICSVPPGAFLPPPKVDSAVIRITCLPMPLANATTLEEVFRLTKVAFGQKRKMLSNSIGKIPDGLHRLRAAAIDPTRRPQTLTVQEWITLAQLVLRGSRAPEGGGS